MPVEAQAPLEDGLHDGYPECRARQSHHLHRDDHDSPETGGQPGRPPHLCRHGHHRRQFGRGVLAHRGCDYHHALERQDDFGTRCHLRNHHPVVRQFHRPLLHPAIQLERTPRSGSEILRCGHHQCDPGPPAHRLRRGSGRLVPRARVPHHHESAAFRRNTLRPRHSLGGD